MGALPMSPYRRIQQKKLSRQKVSQCYSKTSNVGSNPILSKYAPTLYTTVAQVAEPQPNKRDVRHH